MRHQFAAKFAAGAALLTLWFSAPGSVHAQGNSLFSGSGVTRGGTGGITGGLSGSGFSSSGMSGRSTTGGAMSGGLGGTGGSLGGGFGGQGGGASPFGGAGMGGMQQGGLGGGVGFGQTGANAGMVGRTNTGFAGNSRAGQTGAGAGGGASRNFGNAGGNFGGQRGNNNFQGQQQIQRTTSAVRPRLRVAFEHTAQTPQSVATKVTSRIERIGLKSPALSGVHIRVEGDQLVLTGRVKTAAQSRLATNLLRHEPGVRTIRNELELEQPADSE